MSNNRKKRFCELGEIVDLPNAEKYGQIPVSVVKHYMSQCNCNKRQALEKIQTVLER